MATPVVIAPADILAESRVDPARIAGTCGYCWSDPCECPAGDDPGHEVDLADHAVREAARRFLGGGKDAPS